LGNGNMSATALDMLAAVRAIGGDVKIVAPGRLRVVAPAPLPNELIEKLRAAKLDLLTLLTSSSLTPPTADTWSEEKEEWAAVVECIAGVPRAWAEGFVRLDPSNPPGDVPPRRWLRFIDDFGRFLDGAWASRAAELGWGPLDLFGCDRERPFARVDQLGLLWLLNGGIVVELHRDRAILQTEKGAAQTYRRRPVEVGRVVLAWEVNEIPQAARS
jgi:hypothetical protein